MNELLTFAVIGLTTGSVYALTATGLVLTYKTSGIFNFAHGAVAAAGAYVFYEARTIDHLPWPLAALISLGLVGVLGGLLTERLANALSRTSVAVRVVATVGLLIGLQGIFVLRYGSAARAFPPFLPTWTFRLPGVNVGIDQAIIVVLAAASTAVLYAFFKRSRLGTAMLGVVEDPDLLGLLSYNPAVVRRYSWIIGCCFAAASGMLLAPTIGLDAAVLTLLIVQAFGAAAIGGFNNLAITYAGGLMIGVGQAMTIKYLAVYRAFQGLPSTLPFIVLFAVLLVTPARRLVERGAVLARRVDYSARLDRRVSVPAIIAGMGALLLVPSLVGGRLPVYTNALVFVILFASLGLLVRTSGQVSLCQLAFAAVGAAAFAHLSAAGIAWPLALIGAGLVTVPVGAIVAIPAIRLPGIYLAVATFGFGILLERLFYTTFLMFGQFDAHKVARPSLGGFRLATDTGYYYVVLAVALACCAVVVVVQRSRLGRLLGALADSPRALAAGGTNTNITRIYVFCISAFLAGIAGALAGPITGTASGLTFDFSLSLELLAVLFICGRRPVLSPFLASAAIAVVPAYIKNPTLAKYVPVVFGLAALAVAIAPSLDLHKRMFDPRRTAARALRSPMRSRVAIREMP